MPTATTPAVTAQAAKPRFIAAISGLLSIALEVQLVRRDTAFGKLPDDPLLHACVVAYASDLTLLDTAVMSHAHSWDDDRFMIASLDHAMWFHRPFRADDWLLYHQTSPSASGARGLAEGQIFTRDGRLAVTVIQEGLIRPIGGLR